MSTNFLHLKSNNFLNKLYIVSYVILDLTKDMVPDVEYEVCFRTVDGKVFCETFKSKIDMDVFLMSNF